MTNMEIIELLKEQIQASNKREAELLARINELTQEIASLKEALLKKGESLGRQQRIAKGLAKLVSCQSEKQDMPAGIISDDERERKERERAAARKERGNNGAKRDMHYEMETVEHDVYPEDEKSALTFAITTHTSTNALWKTKLPKRPI